MSDYMTLVGADEVSRAGSRIDSAAQDIQRAMASFDFNVERLIRALDDHASRIEVAFREQQP